MKHKIYQIESIDGNHELPEGLWSFEGWHKRKNAEKYMRHNNLSPDEWKIFKYKESDIEEPTFLD